MRMNGFQRIAPAFDCRKMKGRRCIVRVESSRKSSCRNLIQRRPARTLMSVPNQEDLLRGPYDEAACYPTTRDWRWLRVSRTKVGGNNVARQNSSSSASRKKTPAMYTQPEESNAAQKAIRTVGSLPSDDVATTPTMAPNPRKLKKPRSEHGNDKKQTDSPFCPSSTKTTTQPSVPAQRRQPTSSSTKADHLTVGGMRVSVVPDETVAVCEALPALQRSRMSLSEEMVVSFIKRHIVDEVCPEKSVSEIDIRTPSGLLLGQDHSLRFIRAILWPPSKGDFVLKYSCSKKSLF